MKNSEEFDVIDEEDGWLLLEEKTINDRTIVCWYNPNTNNISIMIMHLTDRPNELSNRTPETQWGWVTHIKDGMCTSAEAAEVVGLYLKDMENDDYWWENK